MQGVAVLVENDEGRRHFLPMRWGFQPVWVREDPARPPRFSANRLALRRRRRPAPAGVGSGAMLSPAERERQETWALLARLAQLRGAPSGQPGDFPTDAEAEYQALRAELDAPGADRQ